MSDQLNRAFDALKRLCEILDDMPRAEREALVHWLYDYYVRSAAREGK